MKLRMQMLCLLISWLSPEFILGPVHPLLAADDEVPFWSFQPIRTAAPPNVRRTEWSQSIVDHFILAKLEEHRKTPSAAADKRTLIRRATFDLIGLPPSPDEIDEFLADESPDSFARVIDRLLASPRYGERWGRHWLDVVRYADARDLIQLPAESDFREAWRYRDWVVAAFNRDLPYDQFVINQLAGDLLQPADPARIDAEALVATGMLAIADFVPGDVDKQQMIADYVNDQIDVVGRAFLGLTLACARCHDHKFDPVSTEEYYSLAGIFFSTRLIPGPVKGNTPLVRVPLISPAEIAARDADQVRDKARLAELSRDITTLADREYQMYLQRRIAEESSRYLLAACDFVQAPSGRNSSAAEFAQSRQLEEGPFLRWYEYFVESHPHPVFKKILDLATQDARREQIVDLSEKLQKIAIKNPINRLRNGRDGGSCDPSKSEVPERPESLPRLSPENQRDDSRTALHQEFVRQEFIRFCGDDRRLMLNDARQVISWPNRGWAAGNAVAVAEVSLPLAATAMLRDGPRGVLRFAGQELLQAPGNVPPAGSLFVVYRPDRASGSQRLLGWEDSSVGQHGIGLMTDGTGSLQAIMRRNGASGDVVVPALPPDAVANFQIVCVTWGAGGINVYRNGEAVGTNQAINGVSSDPAITSLRIGGPGSGSAARFQGEIAELIVYSTEIDANDRAHLTSELTARWCSSLETSPPVDEIADLYEELVSPLSPFQRNGPEREQLFSEDFQKRLAGIHEELEQLKKKPAAPVIPQAVAVQDGGPAGTPHEGFQDAAVYLRGNHTKPGKKVPRGVPKAIIGPKPLRIQQGSGRSELARWLVDPANPLTARVMINRIWQHHFGTGIVRTSANFGIMGEFPSHPELLDELASRFVASGWSIKTMHRQIMLSSTYQLSGFAVNSVRNEDALAESKTTDPENRFLGRFNRRRLEAEGIRDSLLAVAGRLDDAIGGPGVQDAASVRRSLYLMSVRTGAKAADSAQLFDAPDCSGIVERRTESIVAPQALYLMNDAFVTELATNLADRIALEIPVADRLGRIRRLYDMTCGRSPVAAEIEVGTAFLGDSDSDHRTAASAVSSESIPDVWARYCHLILCTNEFIYVD